MRKTEMALWLAGFIGWERGKDYSIGNEDIVPLIYSPDGFFAVWDAVEEQGWINVDMFRCPADYRCDMNFNNVRATDGPLESEGYGKDRYEAFYNAVYQAMQ